MNVQIDSSWKAVLEDEFSKPYFNKLTEYVKQQYAENICYPKGKQIFSAFDHCPLDRVKVVIIGQDPYHGEGQANGLCFSVHDGIAHPPSLINIFRDLLPYQWQFGALGIARSFAAERHSHRKSQRSR